MQWLVRDPVFFDLNKPTAALQHLLYVELRNSQLAVRGVHALEVLIASEHDDSFILSSVCFGTLKTLDSVM